jgi:hypothetical protein
MAPTSSKGTAYILSEGISTLKCSLRSQQFQRLLFWIVSLLSILDFLLLGVSTTYERTVKIVYLFMCKVKDDSVASWRVASLSWHMAWWAVVGKKKLLLWLKEAKRIILTFGRSLDYSVHSVSSSKSLMRMYTGN